ncbi:MAG: hypothetical protein QNI84_09105 [Henriciella sp.]|nr:hypothetical protein [Henriciella sp.]
MEAIHLHNFVGCRKHSIRPMIITVDITPTTIAVNSFGLLSADVMVSFPLLQPDSKPGLQCLLWARERALGRTCAADFNRINLRRDTRWVESQLLNFENEVEKLFRAFAAKHGLRIELKEQNDLELLMTIPLQEGLSFELNLGLQNGDEINIGFKDFWSYIFPYPSVKSHVETLLDGIVTGDTRLVTKSQFGRTVSRTLEYLEGDDWAIGYKQISGLKVPFIKSRMEYFSNES